MPKTNQLVGFLHAIGGRVRPPFSLDEYVRLIIPVADMHCERLFTGDHCQIWTGGDQ
jgi:hypothetical protein